MTIQETIAHWREISDKLVAENEQLSLLNWRIEGADYEELKQFAEANQYNFKPSYDAKSYYCSAFETSFSFIIYTRPVEIRHTYEVINL
jgi:hypothetical protein